MPDSTPPASPKDSIVIDDVVIPTPDVGVASQEAARLAETDLESTIASETGVSPSGSLNFSEGLRIVRDVIIFTAATIAPPLFDYLGHLNFGNYQGLASVLLAAAAVTINRFFNIYRPR